MNKKLLFTLIAGTLTLAGCEKPVDTTTTSEVVSENTKNTPTETEQEANSMVGTIEKINEEWNRYTNTKLGFSVEYPQVNYMNGKEYLVDIIEDGNIVYLSDGTQQAEIDQKKNESEVEKASGIPFAFLIKEVNNDKALDSFIKERYGKNCKLGEEKTSETQGVFDVKIDTSWKNPEPTDGITEEDCFINYITLIKYNAEKGKVVTWDIGQDANFYDENSEAVDEKITNSFKFL